MSDEQRSSSSRVRAIQLCGVLIVVLAAIFLVLRPSENAAGGGRLPTLVYLTMITVGYVLGLFVVAQVGEILRRRQSRLQAIIPVAANIALILAFCELVFFVLYCRKLASDPSLVRIEQAAARPDPTDAAPGAAPNYQPHHYLNYVLNPDVPYLGTLQYNAKYKIRRQQPILPRDESRFRVLTLGGSTTFGEQLPRSQDTWPAQLEQLIRQRYGDDCDVINGGVGGYNLLENMLHYVIMLSDLDPDLVLLYEGINDVHPRLYPTVELDYSNYRQPWRIETRLPTPHPWLRYLYTYRYFFAVIKLEPIASGGIHDTVSSPYPSEEVWVERLRANPPTHYRDHLEDCIEFLRGQGKTVVIIPQYYKVRSERDALFVDGVRENNQVNQEVAESMGAPFLEDLLREDTFTEQELLDNCHFNEAGSKKMARIVFDFLEQSELIRLP